MTADISDGEQQGMYMNLQKAGMGALCEVSTLLCAALLSCGCVTHREIEFDAQNPAVRVSRQGVLFDNVFVEPDRVPEILDDYDVPKTRTIHIRLDSDVRDLRQARALMWCLGRAGYKNPVLVTERHAESVNLGKPRKGASAPKQTSSPRGKIRYKGADE